MSNLEAVTKVADQIISRLFDQRQFTNGEINYMVKEFGERVDLDANFDKLLKMNESVCVISDTNRADLCLTHDAKLEAVCDQVSTLIERTERILKLESQYRERGQRLLDETKRKAELRKEECMKDCNTRLEKLRESIVEEELEFERKYLKFEENLRNK